VQCQRASAASSSSASSSAALAPAACVHNITNNYVEFILYIQHKQCTRSINLLFIPPPNKTDNKSEIAGWLSYGHENRVRPAGSTQRAAAASTQHTGGLSGPISAACQSRRARSSRAPLAAELSMSSA
jgi:hypothetical protein